MMEEEQYLLELERLLMHLSVRDRIEIMREVSAYFLRGRLSGSSEDTLMEELGQPCTLAAEPFAISQRIWRSRQHVERSQTPCSFRKETRIWPSFSSNQGNTRIKAII